LIGACAGASAKLPSDQQQKLPPPAARAVGCKLTLDTQLRAEKPRN